MSARRGRELCDAYHTLGLGTWLVEGEPKTPSGALEQFAALISATIKLQVLCVQIADRLALELERPRAGRPLGEEHLRIQTALMAT